MQDDNDTITINIRGSVFDLFRFRHLPIYRCHELSQWGVSATAINGEILVPEQQQT
jgi:hypothetical protein